LQPKGSAPEYMTLPIIIGVDTKKVAVGQPMDDDAVKSALELIRDCPDVLQSRYQIATIDVSKEYCLTATNKQGVAIKFDPDDLMHELRELDMLVSYCERSGRDLASANLMPERNIPVVFKEPALAEASPQPSAQPTASPEPIVRRALPVTHPGQKSDRSSSPTRNTHKKTKSKELKPFNG
jgi:hypothetical protein